MNSDFMDRSEEMLLLDACLTTKIENIAKLQDNSLRLPLVSTLGIANIDRIDAMYEIFVEAEKRAARYIVYKAQACGYIDSYDGVAIRQMITHMGEEDLTKWN
jgi:hypothetical protein